MSVSVRTSAASTQFLSSPIHWHHHCLLSMICLGFHHNNSSAVAFTPLQHHEDFVDLTSFHHHLCFACWAICISSLILWLITIRFSTSPPAFSFVRPVVSAVLSFQFAFVIYLRHHTCGQPHPQGLCVRRRCSPVFSSPTLLP